MQPRTLASTQHPRDGTHTPAAPASQEPVVTPQGERAPLDAAAPPLAGSAGWLLVLIANVAVSVWIVLSGKPAGPRFEMQLFDGGYLAALAALTWLLVAGWCRIVPARARAAWPLVLFVIAVAVAWFVLVPDMSGFAQRRRSAGSQVPWELVVVFVAGVSATLCAWVPKLHWLLRPACVAAALGIAVANHFIQPHDYRGAHLYAVWFAALLGAGALLPSARALLSARPRFRPAAFALPAVLFLWGTAAVVVEPREPVWRDLARSPGSVLAPYVASMRELDTRELALAQAAPDWFKDRSRFPAVPPTPERILPDDGIVILITIDAVRADIVATDEHEKLMPTLTTLRREGVHFEMARAPSPSTLSSVMGIMSGKYYSQLFWAPENSKRWNGRVLPHLDVSPRLPQLLSNNGIRTVHLIASHGLDRSSGVSAGFDEIEKTRRNGGGARSLTNLLLKHLGKKPGPAFYYLHYFDPHAPYNRGGKKGTAFERYLLEVEIVDKQLARLRREIEKRGLRDRTMLIVSADHGEAFGEHGMHQHARSLYEEVLRVPLIASFPDLQPHGVSEPVTLLDLGPTVLDLFGLNTPAQFMGQSLVPAMLGRPVRFSRPIAADSGRRMQAFYSSDGKKAITDLRMRTRELYDLTADPKEAVDLTDTEGAAPYFAELRAFFDAHTLRVDGYEPPWRRF